MQATVRSFDQQTLQGSVLQDDGVELPFDADAFRSGGVRLLRSGQRVRIRTDGTGTRVVFLTIATLPDPPPTAAASTT